MKKRTLFLSVIILLILQKSFAQSCPANIDFEAGDFTNWECFTGTTSAVNGVNKINLTLSGPVAGRHEIISAASTVKIDRYGKFPTLCPYGGTYSVKLGNESTGAQAEGLSYTFTVPASIDTFTFTYFYAVVFQDPDHPLPQQPRFFVTAYDVLSGAVINCASYDYVSDGGIPGFQISSIASNVLYKDWTPASLQFAGLQNRTVRLEFKTADCTVGGHFGYAYVDVGSACSNILATAPFCVETNSLVLNAPFGFKSYTWYNDNYTAVLGNTRSLTLSPPPVNSGIFHVDLVPYPGYGCRDTSHAMVQPLPVPDTPVAQSDYGYCQLQTATGLTATATSGNALVWYTTATGGVGSSTAPIPSTLTPGVYDYYVTQKVLFGCESLRKKITVRVIASPQTLFTINTAKQCQNGNQFVFTSTSTKTFNSTYAWDFGDGQTQGSANDSIVNHTYTTSGTFQVKLKVTNDGACSTEKTLPVSVIPKPIAAFSYPNIICEKQTTIALVNNSSVPGGVATINKWWWNIDGAIVSLQTPASFIPNTPGDVTIKLLVTTVEGCNSDTNSVVIKVHYRPSAAFKYSNPLCDNETTRFTDQSSLPPAAAQENIVKWSWLFGGSSTINQQHPNVNLLAGAQSIKLITETNFGCKSTEADSLITINAKPQIRLSINDSCINRIIKYNASDITNTVTKWHWNFGAGFSTGASLTTKTFATEGSNPLVLMGETIKGCKDTINRPFTIYDNKAFAGRDTVAAFGEPVQLNANGGANVKYTWTPTIGLNDPTKENPIAILRRDQLYKLDAITDKGCDAHSMIMIKRYAGPELYIPTAFTPNGDGLNDVLKVIPIGIKSFKTFSVFNRYGQRMFYTTNYNEGWDGMLNGKKAEAGTYVAFAEAIDYRGIPMMNKVTVVIIR